MFPELFDPSFSAVQFLVKILTQMIVYVFVPKKLFKRKTLLVGSNRLHLKRYIIIYIDKALYYKPIQKIQCSQN